MKLLTGPGFFDGEVFPGTCVTLLVPISILVRSSSSTMGEPSMSLGVAGRTRRDWLLFADGTAQGHGLDSRSDMLPFLLASLLGSQLFTNLDLLSIVRWRSDFVALDDRRSVFVRSR